MRPYNRAAIVTFASIVAVALALTWLYRKIDKDQKEERAAVMQTLPKVKWTVHQLDSAGKPAATWQATHINYYAANGRIDVYTGMQRDEPEFIISAPYRVERVP